MAKATTPPPKNFKGVMVSSTFTDLKEHRQKAIDAINGFGFVPVVMEFSGANATKDVVETSLQMVADCAAYVGVISLKYGQTPVSAERNPKQLSITELEFDEAMRLGRPILLFIMGEDHPVKKADIELDPGKLAKLDAFRERAKKMREGSDIHRVYCVFNSLEQFATEATVAIGNLKADLEKDQPAEPDAPPSPEPVIGKKKIATPPALEAQPDYLGSHDFVGRAAELDTLDDWCAAADPKPMLLYEAMGGAGKSMLAWRWLRENAPRKRPDWAGRFWYSFYESGATMEEFCRQALAYMGRRDPEDFRQLRTPELCELLVGALKSAPWLFVLDGLERVLVAYHRIDAAELRDENVEDAKDQIARRDPRMAIRPADDDLLRKLADVAPSKILVTSRLTPHALVNPSDMPMPGVRRELLKGLRPPDAEAFLRACGVRGDSDAMQSFAQSNCDCHPLVLGALAGLINHYAAAPGDFDRWADDPDFGGKLKLADLDLAQKKTHILDMAIEGLSPMSLQVLQTLSLLQSGADFDVLKALNPHLPAKPDEVGEPEDPEKGWFWKHKSKADQNRSKKTFRAKQQAHKAYLASLESWRNDPAVRAAPQRLAEALTDLRKRGLAQHEASSKRYDLHPVVRGIVAGRLSGESTKELGQKVVDYFNARPHDPYEQAARWEDVEQGVEIVRTYLRMGDHENAFAAYRGDLASALIFNLDARAQMLALLRGFFPDGWAGKPALADPDDQSYALTDVAFALGNSDRALVQSLFDRMIELDISRSNLTNLRTDFSNLALQSKANNKITLSLYLRQLALDVAEAADDAGHIFGAHVGLFESYVVTGDRRSADAVWARLSVMQKPSNRGGYREGDLESWRASDLFWRGELDETFLREAEQSAIRGKSHQDIRQLHRLRGQWRLSHGEPGLAIASLENAVRMARESGQQDFFGESLLALAQLRAARGTGREAQAAAEARSEAELLDQLTIGNALAELWRELGERDRAVACALDTHAWAVGDGEPYVWRYYLDQARKLLAELGEPLPPLPVHDPSTMPVFAWEADVRKLIEKTRAERAEREAQEAETKEKRET